MPDVPSSFDHFVREHGEALSRLARVLSPTRPDAEDLLQEALLAIYRRWDRVGRADNVGAYARRVLINEFLMATRRGRASQAPMVRLDRHTNGPGEDDVDSYDFARRTLAGLQPKQQAVLALRYLDDLGDEDIARVMGCRRSTVRSLAKRGLDNLRRQLDQPAPSGKGYIR
ncbi:MAG: SigE family RNA polymerase sigma factor [Acidothermales bacterium]|nr:SigE family RNA polymerase sigma factor [Acidothermales bacterium]